MKEKMPEYGEVLDLAEKLLEAKRQMMQKLSSIPLLLEKKRLRTHLEEGFPYLKLSELPLDLAQAEGYFFHLLEIFNAQNPQKYKALRDLMKEKNFSFFSFLKSLCAGQIDEENLSRELGPEGSLLFFFLVQVLRPFLEKQAQQWEKERIKDVSWGYGYCPFCGGYAGMGELREEGQRILHCSLCFTEWSYARLKCPYCMNTDQQKLSYFQVEGEADKRVDVCLLCQQYLKTIDSREREKPLDWEIEDYLTLYLDFLAQEEGFRRPAKLFMEVK